MHTTMKELPISERPYDKCESFGTSVLSHKELLTVLIRSGTKKLRADEIALKVLETCGDEGLKKLFSYTFEDFEKIEGIGRVKAIELMCVCEFAKRMSSDIKLVGQRFNCAENVVSYYKDKLKYNKKESVYEIILNSKNEMIWQEELSKGTIDMSIADIREVLGLAYVHHGTSIILLHNHPSGDPLPSADDIGTTRMIAERAGLVGLSLLDHIIIGYNDFFSMKENKLFDQIS